MLSLDALEGNAPDVWMVLTTRTATVDMEAFYRARAKVMRALRRRWPQLEYASCLEYTTGFAQRSGGERRPHWNKLLKGVRKRDIAAIRKIAVRIWCAHVDADPAGQYVGDVYAKGGLMRYLAKHFQKSSQRPPADFKGQRFNCSKGYFGQLSRAQARARAKDSLSFKRELRRARKLGLVGARADDYATESCRWNCRRIWAWVTPEGIRCRPGGWRRGRLVVLLPRPDPATGRRRRGRSGRWSERQYTEFEMLL
jgi:hypothetical protein